MNNIELSRRNTFNDLLEKLNKYGICAFLRPTGFGKTYTLVDLIERYKNVIFFYPAKVIKNTACNVYTKKCEEKSEYELAETIKELQQIPNCKMMSYNKLARMNQEDIDELKDKFDLIIFDECHKLGGNKTKINAKLLISSNTRAHIVGATATANRTDGYDVIHDMFKDITVYPYTLHDAFQDGLLAKPYYFFCTESDIDKINSDLKESAFTSGENIDDLRVKEVLKSKALKICNMMNIADIIKNNCNKYIKSSYIKFIVFFKNIDDLNNKKSEVENWFKTAYPNKTINTLVISSESIDLSNNVNRLDDMTYKEDHIDLIMCIDMLNMGYHVNDISGIIMYRCTNSNIIYTQQLGRALSSGSDKCAVVFDIVDNIHRKVTINLPEEIKKNHKTNVKWWIDIDKIEAEDLIIIDYQARYRELIAKAVAESMSQRCREAFEWHFMKYCKANGIQYPINEKQLKEIYKLDKNEYIESFKNIIKTNNISYPIGDAKKLLKIGKNKNDGIPLKIFAKWKSVSVDAILDLLGILNN